MNDSYEGKLIRDGKLFNFGYKIFGLLSISELNEEPVSMVYRSSLIFGGIRS